MGGFVKYLDSKDGKLYLLEAITDPQKVTDALLDELAKDEKNEYIKSVLEVHKTTPLVYVISGGQKIEYDENLHG